MPLTSNAKAEGGCDVTKWIAYSAIVLSIAVAAGVVTVQRDNAAWEARGFGGIWNSAKN